MYLCALSFKLMMVEDPSDQLPLLDIIIEGYFSVLALLDLSQDFLQIPPFLRTMSIKRLSLLAKLIRIRKDHPFFQLTLQTKQDKQIVLLVHKQLFSGLVANFNRIIKSQKFHIFHNLLPVFEKGKNCLTFQNKKLAIFSCSQSFYQENLLPIQRLFQQGNLLSISYFNLKGINSKKVLKQGISMSYLKDLINQTNQVSSFVGLPLSLSLLPYSTCSVQFYGSGYQQVQVWLKGVKIPDKQELLENGQCLLLPQCRLQIDQFCNISFKGSKLYRVPNLFFQSFRKLRHHAFSTSIDLTIDRIPRVHLITKILTKFVIIEFVCSVCKSLMVSKQSCQRGCSNQGRLSIFATYICQSAGELMQVVFTGKHGKKWLNQILQKNQQFLKQDCLIYKKIKLFRTKTEFHMQADGKELPFNQNRIRFCRLLNDHLIKAFVVGVYFCDRQFIRWQLTVQQKAELAASVYTLKQFVNEIASHPNGVVVRQAQNRLMRCLRVVEVLTNQQAAQGHADQLLKVLEKN